MYYFWKFVQEEFAECIKIHIELFALLQKVRPFLNATFLVVYYQTVLNLVFGTFYVLQMKTASVFALVTLYYCAWGVFECASLTRGVSLLTEANESIALAVYSLNWPTALVWDDRFKREYRAVRQTMLNVMIVSQQPLRLNCFGFFEFTQDRFYGLLNMAYSLFTFLRHFV